MQFSDWLFLFMLLTWKVLWEKFALHNVTTNPPHGCASLSIFSPSACHETTQWLNDVRVSHDKNFSSFRENPRRGGSRAEKLAGCQKEEGKVCSMKSIWSWIEFSVVLKFPSRTEDLWLKAMRIRKQSGAVVHWGRQRKRCSWANLIFIIFKEARKLFLHPSHLSCRRKTRLGGWQQF